MFSDNLFSGCGFQVATSDWRRDRVFEVIETVCTSLQGNCLHRATRHQYARVGFENGPINAVEIQLWVAFAEIALRESFATCANGLKVCECCLAVWIAFTREPKHAGAIEERRWAIEFGEEFLPELQRVLGRARVDLVRTITETHDARFATGTRAAVSRAIRVEQQH